MSSLLSQPAQRKHAWIAITCTVAIWLLLLLSAGLWSLSNLNSTIPLQQAPLAIQLPKFMPVSSTVSNQLVAHLDHSLSVQVPVNQAIEAYLPHSIPTDINLSTRIDLKTTINYQAMVPIESVFEMDAPIDHPLVPFNIPIKLPMAFEVPVNLEIPVHQTIPLNLQTTVIAKVAKPVPAELITTLKSEVPIKATINTKVVSNAEAHLMLPTAPIQLNLTRADLTIAMKDISLVRSELNYPEQKALRPIDQRDLIYVYDANKKPPSWR